MEILLTVGKRIREAREAKRMTQLDLARRIGTGQSKIAAYEAGQIEIGLTRLIELAKALDVLPSELMKASD